MLLRGVRKQNELYKTLGTTPASFAAIRLLPLNAAVTNGAVTACREIPATHSRSLLRRPASSLPLPGGHYGIVTRHGAVGVMSPHAASGYIYGSCSSLWVMGERHRNTVNG
ncbi:hypothetical protein TGPRC2_234375 [Toxoplasma gondii TgCatPRC2]|uniref:Uncharacterized protein n=3 Tax=Toxoplasma gondii TaxID=5811 RepID=A0A151HQM7_TOXGO|nr:hypothetical protein TGME49_234375 [Toxoplasma gondii ME49]EPT26797.1 hypothetical protein TGME49_234375 [Toxoplasma gondii ME49]KFG45951.1 hypothetical protein TGDOM2_234375 [Toxoplasma gondii GAB2-2007-GAL-DOM2]KYK71580.1 hypothetical protein TGPRC2_234375 [Toxoplasma gondii TgCatPRC2]|eukprot:XP_018635858.1 hypothetical protein TGME49_234375 [Toxoplasma gondii ME49]